MWWTVEVLRSVVRDWFSAIVVFFFKQKTAYELRISDWSSDVCSSDLWRLRFRRSDQLHRAGARHGRRHWGRAPAGLRPADLREIGRASCRERVCPYVSISVVAVSLNKTVQQGSITDTWRSDRCDRSDNDILM